MSTPAELRWRLATAPYVLPPGTWHALYRHPCVGCCDGIAVGDVVEYARDRGGNIAPGGPRYRHARDACRGLWRVRREVLPQFDDGVRVPLPAVWAVRDPTGRLVFVTSDALLARLIADARAHNRPDPDYDPDDPEARP